MGGNVTPTAMHKVVVNDGESTGRGTTTVPVSNASVTINLQDSMGSPLIDGVVKYYSGGWNDFGTTDENGQVSKELPIGTCQFRMTYEHGSNDISQDLVTDPTVVFSTGKIISDSGACTHYYSVGWQIFTNDMEMLPGSYKFSFSDETPDGYYNIDADTTNNIH